MPKDPDDLRAGDCPLLAKHSADAGGPVAAYNGIAADLRALRADPELARLADHPEFQKAVAAPLERVRRDLTRARYCVGFIGLSQAGKSTTVNNLLGSEVCKSGTGKATSSQPARMFRAAADGLDVAYLTAANFEARRLELCKEIGLPSPGADDDLFAQLKDDAVFADVQDKPRLKKDREFLGVFLRSRRACGADYLRADGRVDSGLPFADRLKYTTHAEGAPENQTLLIKEARFHLALPALPDDLEICDLPGLGSERTVDDLVTFEYLPDLNGGLLFVNASMNMKDISLTNAFNRFRRAFDGNISSRAWVVFTKVDGLSDNYFRPGKENIFTVVREVLEEHQIPLSQVCFVSNELYKELSTEPPAGRRAWAARRLKQPADRPVPETCPPELRAAWEALVEDGGISRLRALVTTDVARSLAAEIRAAVERDLAKIRRDLDHRKATEKARLAGGGQLHEKVGTCRAVVMSLEQALTDEPGSFGMTQRAEELRGRLRQLLDNPETRKVITGLAPVKLPNEFRIHARLLSHTFQTEVGLKVVDPTYEEVGRMLEPLPRVPVGGAAACGAAWQALRDEDAAPAAWAGRLPGFGSDEFAEWLRHAAENGDALTGTVYLDIMFDKINAAVLATMHAIRDRLRARLGEVAAELELLTAAP
ncbi:hypothetical protein [Fimbriiglobus ruber]|uniref:Dynamin family protein n=1 Tax=Fimbriiglobus ruber TaxID=1908690 RepID=A0A225D657_9BACT|nr:hypothetical protein [Fimbriiglobus ruber]OWK36463.1 hypothetical protein FRUB_09026 [Fimbriiglobus ruber]